MSAFQNTIQIPKKIQDRVQRRRIELQKDFTSVFSTPAGERVLKHLTDKVKSDNSDPLNPYAVMRKDACIHLLEVYIVQLINKQKV